MASDFQKRDVTLLRDTLSLICHTIWNSGKPPDGKHLWSIPPDRERDFDYILSDGITELVHLREENARLRAWMENKIAEYKLLKNYPEQFDTQIESLQAALRGERGTE